MNRQGDVLIEALSPQAVTALKACRMTPVPRDLERGLILAAGEATGHHHRTTAVETELFRLDAIDPEFARLMSQSGATVLPGDQVLVVKEGPATVVHEEHGSHTILPGFYLITIAEEYVAPLVVRRVMD